MWTITYDNWTHDIILNCDRMLPTSLKTPTRRTQVRIWQIRSLYISVPVWPSNIKISPCVSRFVRYAHLFSGLQKLYITAILRYPHEFHGGERWRRHDNITEDIKAALKEFTTVANLQASILLDVELPGPTAIGYDIDISHCRSDSWTLNYQTEIEDNIRRNQTRRALERWNQRRSQRKRRGRN